MGPDQASVDEDPQVVGLEDLALVSAPLLGANLFDFLTDAPTFFLNEGFGLPAAECLSEGFPSGPGEAVREGIVDRVELAAVEDDAGLRSDDPDQTGDRPGVLIVLGCDGAKPSSSSDKRKDQCCRPHFRLPFTFRCSVRIGLNRTPF